jgi:hypothetical protein
VSRLEAERIRAAELSELEELAVHPGPAALRFLDMVEPDALAPVVMASASALLP